VVNNNMILVIDNYDSFTYNLVQYLGELGEDPVVYRNDKISVGTIRRLAPKKIMISPGPCTPREAGISNECIRVFSKKIPTLGVCLGHQCLAFVFGGQVVRAQRLMHGKTSRIYHEGHPLFRGIESPFEATRYHSLLVSREHLPESLQVIAETRETVLGKRYHEIMGLAHREYPLWGVQFHPESILTKPGKRLLRNFLEL
jgi:anthranilate synthase/aminodeoxychorismate synthase-like glutamine amidotransferase